MKRILLFAAILISQFAHAQLGGSYTYAFLALPSGSRIAGLGGTNITIVDHDLSTQLANPASLNPAMNKEVLFGSAIYAAGTNFGNAAYAQNMKKLPGTFGFGIQYIAYGKFNATDETANITGTFNAGEMNAYAGYAYQFGKIFSVGANAKFIYSQLAEFSSVGMAADIAAMVNDTAHNVTASIVAKNLGGQFKPYTKGVHEPLPFDLQAGLSFGFKHVPFRFHFTFHHLYTWNIRYDNPADQQTDLFLDSSQTKPKKYIADILMRHIIIGIEINIKKIVRIDIAYNHLRQQELQLSTRRAVPGISFGLGLHIKQFDFCYALEPLPQGQSLNYLTLSINTGGFIKKKLTPKQEQEKM